MHRPALALALCAAGAVPGCAAVASSPVREPLRTTDVEVTLTPLAEPAPPGSDGEPRFSVEIHGATGDVRRLEPALAAVSFNAGAAVVGLDHVLSYERLDGGSIRLAEGASSPAASADRSHLAYAVRGAEDLFDVIVHDGSRATVVARGLVSAGAFAFSEDASLVAFVGARNGGRAGAWAASTRPAADDAPRCLSACTAGSIEPMPSAFLDVRPGRVSFTDETGAVRTAAWEGR